MNLRQLVDAQSSTLTYLVFDEKTKHRGLIDCVFEHQFSSTMRATSP